MTKKYVTQAIAAALTAALGFGTVAAPATALAFPAPKANESVAIVAQTVTDEDAINAAVDRSPLYWDDVTCVACYYDESRDDYVMTITAFTGMSWTVWVDATTGVAYEIH